MTNQTIIGIDLGTTQSCVAVWMSDWSRVDVLSNDQGDRTTPSCVAFKDSERLIGAPAVYQAVRNPQNTIFQVKRLMGRNFQDEAIQKHIKMWPFKVQSCEKGQPKIQVEFQGQQKNFRPEEISAMILGKMKQVAELKLGNGNVKKAVVTVPAYFNSLQRQATKDAGTIAGLEVVRIINEPTAAAFAYGLDESVKKNTKHEHVLVFDLGGGTFDVSILKIHQKEFTVVATGGDTNLGGEDFDDVLVNYCASEFYKKEGLNILDNKRAMRRLRIQCERAKRDLSLQTYTTIDIDALYEYIDFSITISRSRLENLLYQFFKQCLDIVHSVVKDAKLSKDHIGKVLLVGGSSRIPKIQEMLGDVFGNDKICRYINPDESVAQGAAIQGAILSGKRIKDVTDIVIQDVIPLDLGIILHGGLMHKIIPKNSSIPCKMRSLLETTKDNQCSIFLDIYQGQRLMAHHNQLIQKFTLEGIKLAPKGYTKVALMFEVDSDGILKVSATEINNQNNKKEITVTRAEYALKSDQIQKMMRDAEQYRKQDEEERQRVVAKLKLTNLLLDTLELTIQYVQKQSLRDVVARTVVSLQDWLQENQNATKTKFQEKILKIEKLLLAVTNRN